MLLSVFGILGMCTIHITLFDLNLKTRDVVQNIILNNHNRSLFNLNLFSNLSFQSNLAQAECSLNLLISAREIDPKHVYRLVSTSPHARLSSIHSSFVVFYLKHTVAVSMVQEEIQNEFSLINVNIFLVFGKTFKLNRGKPPLHLVSLICPLHKLYKPWLEQFTLIVRTFSPYQLEFRGFQNHCVKIESEITMVTNFISYSKNRTTANAYCPTNFLIHMKPIILKYCSHEDKFFISLINQLNVSSVDE